MNMSGFTRPNDVFIKNIENHCYATALHFVYYNTKQHKIVRLATATAAGLRKGLMTTEQILKLMPEPMQNERVQIKRR